jgi:hypothetical protein
MIHERWAKPIGFRDQSERLECVHILCVEEGKQIQTRGGEETLVGGAMHVDGCQANQ